jgi:hypothetical protein
MGTADSSERASDIVLDDTIWLLQLYMIRRALQLRNMQTCLLCDVMSVRIVAYYVSCSFR